MRYSEILLLGLGEVKKLPLQDLRLLTVKMTEYLMQ